MQQLIIPIRGMSCGGCVRNVRDALARTRGVSLETVTVGSAALSYDPLVTDRDTIFTAIEDAGYMPRTN
jgi:copper chaperone CopZ